MKHLQKLVLLSLALCCVFALQNKGVYQPSYGNSYGQGSSHGAAENHYDKKNLAAGAQGYNQAGAHAVKDTVRDAKSNSVLQDGFKTLDEGQNSAASNDVSDSSKYSANRQGADVKSGNQYYKIKTGSLMSCTALKKYEKELKNNYYNAVKYSQSELKSNVAIIKKARNQLLAIIDWAQRQALTKAQYYKNGGAANQASYANGANDKYINANAANQISQGSQAATNGVGAGIYIQQMATTLQNKFSQMNEHQQTLELFNMIQSHMGGIVDSCNKYGKLYTAQAREDCGKLKALSTVGVGYNYCSIPGLQIGAYIEEGLLTKGQLCYAASALKYTKSIYSSSYNLFSGYTKNYLDNSYAATYARRKQICGQDDLHSEIISSSNVGSQYDTNSATGDVAGNNEAMYKNNKHNNEAYGGKVAEVNDGSYSKAAKQAQNSQANQYNNAVLKDKVHAHNAQNSAIQTPPVIKYTRPNYYFFVQGYMHELTKKYVPSNYYNFLQSNGYINQGYQAPSYGSAGYQPRYNVYRPVVTTTVIPGEAAYERDYNAYNAAGKEAQANNAYNAQQSSAVGYEQGAYHVSSVPAGGVEAAIPTLQGSALRTPVYLPYVRDHTGTVQCPKGYKAHNLARVQYQLQSGLGLGGYTGHGINKVQVLGTHTNIPLAEQCTKICDATEKCGSVVHNIKTSTCHTTPYTYFAAINQQLLAQVKENSLSETVNHDGKTKVLEGELFMQVHHPVSTCYTF